MNNLLAKITNSNQQIQLNLNELIDLLTDNHKLNDFIKKMIKTNYWILQTVQTEGQNPRHLTQIIVK